VFKIINFCIFHRESNGSVNFVQNERTKTTHLYYYFLEAITARHVKHFGQIDAARLNIAV